MLLTSPPRGLFCPGPPAALLLPFCPHTPKGMRGPMTPGAGDPEAHCCSGGPYRKGTSFLHLAECKTSTHARARAPGV